MLLVIIIYLLITLNSKKFQTVMASATLHNGIRQLAFVALHKPVYIGLTPKAVMETGQGISYILYWFGYYFIKILTNVCSKENRY